MQSANPKKPKNTNKTKINPDSEQNTNIVPIYGKEKEYDEEKSAEREHEKDILCMKFVFAFLFLAGVLLLISFLFWLAIFVIIPWSQTLTPEFRNSFITGVSVFILNNAVIFGKQIISFFWKKK